MMLIAVLTLNAQLAPKAPLSSPEGDTIGSPMNRKTIEAPLGAVGGASLHLSLDDCIMMARRQSVEAAVALGELRSAYWQWRSYKADLLPEVSLQATLPSWNKRYSSYQQADGSLSFVRNDYLGLDGAVNITQKLWPTGGTLSIESSLDYLHQQLKNSTTQQLKNSDQFMSLPVAVTLQQPLFAVNHLKWNRRIEPLRYREAIARFLTETEQVAMQAIDLYFSLLLAGEQVNIARQNLQTAEKLYEVAQAKRRMGTISQNDVLQLRLDVLTARSALTNSESARQAAQFALRSFLDVEADIELIMPDSVFGGFATEIPRLSYEAVLAHALHNNALATTMRRRQMEADYAVAAARANRQSINLYAQLGYTGTGNNLNRAYRDLLSNEVVQVGITVPLLATFRICPRWNVSLGPYLSYYWKQTFTGEVYDNDKGIGYLREDSPVGTKILMTRENPTPYPDDFADSMRPMSVGMELCFDWKALRHMNVFGSLDWGLTDIWQSDFEAISFRMYPIYGTLGVAYRY